MNGYQILKPDFDQLQSQRTYHNNRIAHIYDRNHFHIARYAFKKDTFLYIDETGEDEVKTYTILSGQCVDLKTKAIIQAGDVLVIGSAYEVISLHMLEDTQFLLHAQKPDGIERFKTGAEKMHQILLDIQNKDHYTKEHCDRVYQMAAKIGLALDYYGERFLNLVKAAHFHDVGKIHISDEVLNKIDPLTREEYDCIKTHVTLGEMNILEAYDRRVYEIVVQHHERLDGSGYPLGLSGDAIMEEARILAICDSFDAMTTDRIYKKGKSREIAFAELRSLAGTKYDPRLVELFIELFGND